MMIRPKKSRLDDVVGLGLLSSDPGAMSLTLLLVFPGSALISSGSPPALYLACRAAVF